MESMMAAILKAALTSDIERAKLRRSLQDAVDWNDEYKRLNNLVGDPYWVPQAREILKETNS